MISMNRPSRGDRESATTTRYAGRRFDPIRLNRIATGTTSPPHGGKSRKPPLAFQLLHQLAELGVLLEQAVHVLHAGAAAARDALATAAVDDVRVRALRRRHRRDDRVESSQVRLLGLELLRRPADLLAERQHAEDLVQRAELSHLLQLAPEVLQRERILAELPDHFLG